MGEIKDCEFVYDKHVQNDVYRFIGPLGIMNNELYVKINILAENIYK